MRRRAVTRTRLHFLSRTPLVVILIALALIAAGVDAIAWPQIAAAASTAASPPTVPPLPAGVSTVPRPATPVAPATPAGDFSTLTTAGESAGSHFDPQRSTVVARSMFTTEYLNPDGTHSIKESTAPLNVQDNTGAWQPVDTTLTTTTASGGSRRAPRDQALNPSLASTADDPSVLSVQVGGAAASLSMDQVSASPVNVSHDKATYSDVQPNTDLDYQVTASAVKETVLLKKAPPSAKSSWTFHLRTTGLTPVVDQADEVELRNAAGVAKIVLPPIETWDASGTARTGPAMTGGTYQVRKDAQGWALTVSVDPKWLHDPKRVYPVHVDPTFSFGVDISHDYRSDGFTCDNCGLRIGNSLDAGDTYNRAAFHFSISSLWGKTVVGAQLNVSQDTSFVESNLTWGANLYQASALNFNGVGGFMASALVGNTGSFVGGGLTAFLQNAVAHKDSTGYYMMLGTETPGTWSYKHLIGTLVVDTGTAPPAPVLAGPADNSVLTSLTPALSVNPVTDSDGDAVTYCFQVATGTDAQSGVVVNSGCLASPQWTVPAGVLQDGTSYTWQASSHSGITTQTPTWIGHFKVDQRIGDHGPAPVDTVGPATVNLANGNVSVSDGGPTFTTVGGNAGLTFTYNSQQASPTGLQASYYNDLSQQGNISASQQPVLVRTEPQVNVNWGPSSPFAPVLGANYYVVIWQGFFQAPVAGTYQFAGVHSGSANIWVNNTQVYTSTGPSDLNWTQATGVALAAGQQVPIKIQLTKDTDPVGQMRLFTQTTNGTTVPPQLVPSSWLFTAAPPALPQGWSMSADLDGSGDVYTQAQLQDSTVVLTDASGAKHTWTKTSAGGYTPPADEDGVLALDTGGRITVTEGSSVYVFNADGTLASESDVADAVKPATLQDSYSGTPSRLTQITDPVSGRSQVLHYNRAGDSCYGTTSVPSSVDALAPAGMLCKISYWDGSETDLWYISGQLRAVQNPGADMSLYAYEANGLVGYVANDVANDWVNVDPATRNTIAIYTAIQYVSSGGVFQPTKVISPAPEPGAARPEHDYQFDPVNRRTLVNEASLHPTLGFTTKVTYDSAYRMLTSTNATGQTSSQTWNAQDQLLSSTDPAGRESTTVYDVDGRATDSYGPAPVSCFSGQVPTAACAATVAHVQTNYDEGMLGLSASYYTNPTLTGAPVTYATGITGRTDGLLFDTPGAASPAPGVPANGWSARFTGEVTFPAVGTYGVDLWVADGGRVWIDDQLVVDGWRDGVTAKFSGTFTNMTANAVHRIRVEYYDKNNNGLVELNWTPPGGQEQNLPGQDLHPRYGLTTSTVTSESGGVPNKVEATGYGAGGLDPVYGQATSTTQDPTGLNLASGTAYEAPGSGYLRQTTTTMPSGAQTVLSYYGDAETRANPCVAGSAAVNQGGMPKLTTPPTPASGTPITDEQVYDASGRVVAEATAGDWVCTTYDARDRVMKKVYPATASSPARTVTFNYAVGGDPLTTSETDASGTVTTRVDLLGEVVSYTDVQGTVTTTSFDQAGRVTSSLITPPNAADPSHTLSYTYDDADRVLLTVLDGTNEAVGSYDGNGELSSVTYANGSSLAAIGKDQAGNMTSLDWRTSDGHDVVSAVTRTIAGTITDESLGGVDANPAGANYVYDAAGRLVQAYATGHHFTYDYTSTASAACPTNTRANAGRNTNRMRLLDQTAAGTAETDYCYDAADRLLATTGATSISSVGYDSHGNTTSYVSGGVTTTLGWDGADRNVSAATTGIPAQTASVTYTRDAEDRIVRRDATSGDPTATVLYSFEGSDDSPDMTLDVNKRVLTTTVSLPGGVLLTLQNNSSGQPAPTWDNPTVRGDLCMTTDQTGKQVGSLRTYDPFGQPLDADGTVDPQNVPDNSPGAMDFGWLGQHQRPFEHAGALDLVEMGARPYSPLLGRFLSVDPDPGGSDNDYDYAGGDPINESDLNGTCWVCSLWHKATGIARSIGRWSSNHRTLVLSAFSLATMWCPPVSIAFGLGAAYSGGRDAYDDYRRGDRWGAALDVAGSLLSVFGAVGVGIKMFRESEAGVSEFRASTRAGRSKSAKNYRRGAAKAGRRARKSARTWNRRSNRATYAGWGATGAYYARRWVR